MNNQKEITTSQENLSSPEFWKQYFEELKNPKIIPPNCVDGRHWEPTEQLPALAPQALGGSLNFAVLYCLENNLPLTIENIKQVFNNLSEAGFALGLHIDDHSKDNPQKSGCGFADNLPAILQNVIELKETILKILTDEASSSRLNLSDEDVNMHLQQLIQAIEKILKNTVASDNNLISTLQNDPNLDVTVYELKGDHLEKAALVNLQEKSTFNTIKAAQDGKQAFNLDLPYVLEAAKALGIDENYAQVASLALYIATERTLRANQKPLPLIIV